MGVESEASWAAKVAACKTPDHFLTLFKESGVPNKMWQFARWLSENSFQGLYDALLNRFGSWKAFKSFMAIEDIEAENEFEAISELSLEEAISFLGSDPYKLKLYLQHAHPELTEEEVDRIIIRSFKGLVMGSNITKEENIWSIQISWAAIRVQKFPRSTEEPTITIEGAAPEGEHVHIAGCWNRRIRTENGNFKVVIPLKQGEDNEIRLMAVDVHNKLRSPQRRFVVQQEGEAVDDVEELIRMLDGLSAQLLSEIRKKPWSI